MAILDAVSGHVGREGGRVGVVELGPDAGCWLLPSAEGDKVREADIDEEGDAAAEFEMADDGLVESLARPGGGGLSLQS